MIQTLGVEVAVVIAQDLAAANNDMPDTELAVGNSNYNMHEFKCHAPTEGHKSTNDHTIEVVQTKLRVL